MEALGSGSREQRELNTERSCCQEKNFKTHEKNFAPCLLCSDQKNAIILGKDREEQKEQDHDARRNNQSDCERSE